MLFEGITSYRTQTGLDGSGCRTTEHVGGYYTNGERVGTMIKTTYAQQATTTASFATWVDIAPEEVSPEVRDHYLKGTPLPWFGAGAVSRVALGMLPLGAIAVAVLLKNWPYGQVLWLVWSWIALMVTVCCWGSAVAHVVRNYRRAQLVVRCTAALQMDPGVMRAIRYAIDQGCSRESYDLFAYVALNPDEHPLYLEHTGMAARIADKRPDTVYAVIRAIRQNNLTGAPLDQLYAVIRREIEEAG